ncbi:MAG TPA: zinc-ribbon domain-containing protein [Allosphingosinicella sp.]
MLRLAQHSCGVRVSMILTCPSCQTRYVVPDSAIGAAGRKVRCAGCRHSWFQEPANAAAAPAPAPPAFAAPAREAPPPPPSPPARRYAQPEPAPAETGLDYADEPPFRPRRNRAKLWTIAAIVAAALMTAAILAVQYFGLPSFGERIIPVQAAGALDLNGTAVPRRLASGNELLEVRGEIVNHTDEVQRVPQIRAELKDAQGRVVYTWAIAPPVRELQPRGRVAFNSAEVDVPRGGRVLSLTFSPIS